MKRISAIAILIALLAGCGMPGLIDQHADIVPAQRAADDEASDLLTIVFIDVGQGDATLIAAPGGEALLIDAGPEGAGRAAVLPAMRSADVRELIAIIATHYHADHIGGIPEVTDEFIPTDDTPLSPGDTLDVGEATAHVVAAGCVLEGAAGPLFEACEENAASLAIVIEYGAFRMFVGGDLSGGGGNPPYDTVDMETPVANLVGDVDVIQVNHHGSTTSTNQYFLDALSPEVAVISCGDGNDYFHPHTNVLDRLLDADIEVYQTERCWTDHAFDVTVANGNITLTTDGIDYFLNAAM